MRELLPPIGLLLIVAVFSFLTDCPIAATVAVAALNKTWLKILLTGAAILLGFFAFRFTRLGMDQRAIDAGETAARYSGCFLEKSLPMVFPLSATQQLVKGIIFLCVVALTIDRKSLRVIK